jgi:hypothetical protein
MPKTFKGVIAALAVIVLGVAAYNYFAFAGERKVQRALLDLREKVSAPISSGLDTALTAAATKPLFAPEVNISFSYGGELRRTFDREELLRIIIGIKQLNPELVVKLDFSRRNIKIAEGRTATVSALAAVENLRETFESRRLTFTFEKNEDARWQLTGIGECTGDTCGRQILTGASPATTLLPQPQALILEFLEAPKR